MKIISMQPIGFQWEMENPYIFCAHHKDYYPKGNNAQGVDISWSGRKRGSDFSGKDGFSMYHGEVVPGFPVHPHRGFETVTIVINGFVDHSDSNGMSGRYGKGDVQWLTTGSGCQHSEMFPLVEAAHDNPSELFQVWLNLPAKKKFSEPAYKMLWSEEIPEIRTASKDGSYTTIRIIAGESMGSRGLDPCPDSWAFDRNNHVGIMMIKMDPNAQFTMPAISPTLVRNLYFYQGVGKISIEGEQIPSLTKIKLSGADEIQVINSEYESLMLLLEGEPINEPLVQYGPFVMNTEQEVDQAISDYRKTQFGGWPWDSPDPVHERNGGRFAKYIDGKSEKVID